MKRGTRSRRRTTVVHYGETDSQSQPASPAAAAHAHSISWSDPETSFDRLRKAQSYQKVNTRAMPSNVTNVTNGSSASDSESTRSGGLLFQSPSAPPPPPPARARTYASRRGKNTMPTKPRRRTSVRPPVSSTASAVPSQPAPTPSPPPPPPSSRPLQAHQSISIGAAFTSTPVVQGRGKGRLAALAGLSPVLLHVSPADTPATSPGDPLHPDVREVIASGILITPETSGELNVVSPKIPGGGKVMTSPVEKAKQTDVTSPQIGDVRGASVMTQTGGVGGAAVTSSQAGHARELPMAEMEGDVSKSDVTSPVVFSRPVTRQASRNMSSKSPVRGRASNASSEAPSTGGRSSPEVGVSNMISPSSGASERENISVSPPQAASPWPVEIDAAPLPSTTHSPELFSDPSLTSRRPPSAARAEGAFSPAPAGSPCSSTGDAEVERSERSTSAEVGQSPRSAAETATTSGDSGDSSRDGQVVATSAEMGQSLRSAAETADTYGDSGDSGRYSHVVPSSDSTREASPEHALVMSPVGDAEDVAMVGSGSEEAEDTEAVRSGREEVEASLESQHRSCVMQQDEVLTDDEALEPGSDSGRVGNATGARWRVDETNSESSYVTRKDKSGEEERDGSTGGASDVPYLRECFVALRRLTASGANAALDHSTTRDDFSLKLEDMQTSFHRLRTSSEDRSGCSAAARHEIPSSKVATPPAQEHKRESYVRLCRIDDQLSHSSTPSGSQSSASGAETPNNTTPEELSRQTGLLTNSPGHLQRCYVPLWRIDRDGHPSPRVETPQGRPVKFRLTEVELSDAEASPDGGRAEKVSTVEVEDGPDPDAVVEAAVEPMDLTKESETSTGFMTPGTSRHQVTSADSDDQSAHTPTALSSTAGHRPSFGFPAVLIALKTGKGWRRSLCQRTPDVSQNRYSTVGLPATGRFAVVEEEGDPFSGQVNRRRTLRSYSRRTQQWLRPFHVPTEQGQDALPKRAQRRFSALPMDPLPGSGEAEMPPPPGPGRHGRRSMFAGVGGQGVAATRHRRSDFPLRMLSEHTTQLTESHLAAATQRVRETSAEGVRSDTGIGSVRSGSGSAGSDVLESAHQLRSGRALLPAASPEQELAVAPPHVAEQKLSPSLPLPAALRRLSINPDDLPPADRWDSHVFAQPTTVSEGSWDSHVFAQPPSASEGSRDSHVFTAPAPVPRRGSVLPSPPTVRRLSTFPREFSPPATNRRLSTFPREFSPPATDRRVSTFLTDTGIATNSHSRRTSCYIPATPGSARLGRASLPAGLSAAPKQRRSSVYVTSDVSVTSSDPAAAADVSLSYEDPEKRVLELCGQPEPVPFQQFSRRTRVTRKIGEGVYGEVFLCETKRPPSRSVIKIMPIEGDFDVNEAAQKSYGEVLSELVISKSLSDLHRGADSATEGFVRLLSSHVVRGSYPARLRQLWDKFDNEKGSENEHPRLFPTDQLFLVLEYSHAGTDLENFEFRDVDQAVAAFWQIALALAVAEEMLEFEHRDLHWGNVLLRPTADAQLACRLRGQQYLLPSGGVQAILIDFTLSRIRVEGAVVYNNLSEDPALFTATGDRQFEVYRLMRDATGDDWRRFSPVTNSHWLYYVADKLTTSCRYSAAGSRQHRQQLRRLQRLRQLVDGCGSAVQLVLESCQQWRQ